MKLFELYKKRINIRITVIAVITYIIITTIIGVYAGRNSRIAVRQEVSNNLSNQAEVFSKNLEDMIQMRQKQISQIVAEGVFEKYQQANQALPVYDEEFEEIVKSFDKYIRNDETIDRFVFINPNGDGITTELNKVDLRERAYYKECAAKLKNPEPDVIISKTSKLQTLMYSTPIFGQNGSLIGILSVGIGGKHLSRTINRIHNGDLCPYIIRHSGQIIAHSNTDFVMKGENFLKDSEHKVLIEQMLKENGKGFQQYYKNKELVYAGYCPVEGCDWYVVCPLKEKEVNSLKNNSLKIFLTAVFLELIASIFMYFLGLKLTNPIKKVLRGLNDITAGELNLPNLNQKELQEILNMQDEIGELANGLNDLRKKMIEVTQNIQEVSKMVNDSSQVLKASVEEMSNGVNDQASSTEEFSATMDRISDNIEQSTNNAKETAVIAKQTSNNSIEASNKVFQTVEMMKQIEQKINIVDNIAQKTNVLALNATVEAARAGNAGKGFAVVAAEVRKLAELSQNAASEIIKLVKQSYKISQESGEGIKNVLPEIKKTGELVDQISELCQEQSNSISQMKIGIEQINNITQNNSSSAEELSAMASQLYELSTKLEESVKFFKLDK